MSTTTTEPRRPSDESAASEGWTQAPEQSYQWLRPFLPKKVQPLLRALRKRLELRHLDLEEPYHSVYPFIQASKARQENLVRVARIVEERKLPGVVVECGVLDGGTAALMASQTGGSGRPVHLFDAWRGLPETTAKDGPESDKWVGEVVGSPKRVVAALKAVNVDLQRVHFHRGWFHETFPHTQEVDTVALLHVDCDFYEPTVLCLETWLPRMSPGGFIQFDDYSAFQGARIAIDEMLAKRTDLTLETFGTVGHGEAYFIRIPD